MVNFSDLNFLLKFIACIVNIVILIVWTVPDKDGVPPHSFGGRVLFYHANCGYVVILCIFVALYFLDEPPGGWSQRLFIIVGTILFLIVGIIGLIDNLGHHAEGNDLINAILCIVVGVLLLVDFIKSENFC